MYWRTRKCDELWHFHHHATFAFNGQGSKISCMGIACSKPKPQKSAGVICASLFARHRLAREQHRLFLSCMVTGDDKWCLYANIMKIKKWLSPNKRRICRKCCNFSNWHSISSVHGSTHYLQMTKLQYVNWSTTEPQIKNKKNEGQKHQKWSEIFSPCMGTMPSERARQENVFFALRRIVLTLVTLHVQEDLRDLMKIV